MVCLVQNSSNLEDIGGLSVHPDHIPLGRKIAIAVLTVFALTTIAAIVLAVVTVCGGFPFLLAALNTVTIGASVSLPMLTCLATTLLLLCLHNIELLARPSMFTLSTKN